MLIKYFANTFSISHSSLGLFRIGIGILLICDLVSRIIWGYDLISPNGALPLNDALRLSVLKSPFSLYHLSANEWYCQGLLALTGLFYLLYLLGYKERIFGFLSLIFLLSVQNRNPFVLHGGDILLRVFLLFSIFLPTSAYSISHWRPLPETAEASWATFSLFIQIGIMYFFSALYKNGEEWVSGDALFLVFKINWISEIWATNLTKFPNILKVITYSTLFFEFLVLPLIFFSFKREIVRRAISTAILLFHLGILIVMKIGSFPFVCLLGAIVFWPRSITTTKINYKLSIKNLISLMAITTITFSNIFFYAFPEYHGLMKSIVVNTGLYQKWGMFSPSPSRSNIKLYAIAEDSQSTNQSQAIDLIKSHQSHHWQKFLMQIVRPNNHQIRDLYTQHLCEKYKSEKIDLLVRESDTTSEKEIHSQNIIEKECRPTYEE